MSDIFVTGGTGFLGSRLLQQVLKNKKNHVYALLRTSRAESVPKRKKMLIDRVFFRDKRRDGARRLHIIKGDITREGLGLSRKDLSMLKSTIDTIYHCAAVRDFGWDLDAIRQINVTGTEHVLRTALNWKKEGRLKNVSHISTVYIKGDYKKTFRETQSRVARKFNNTYEQSKFEAEKVVAGYREKGLPVDIYRPSTILDTVLRSSADFSLPLMFLRMVMSRIFKEIPVDRDATINLIPLDTAAEAICLISTADGRSANQNYHIVNSRPVKIRVLLSTASDVLGFKKPAFINSEKYDFEGLSAIQKKLMGFFLPHLTQDSPFDMSKASSVLDKFDFKIPRITEKILRKIYKSYKSSGLLPERGNCYDPGK
jgi:thioester reductase-like protein